MDDKPQTNNNLPSRIPASCVEGHNSEEHGAVCSSFPRHCLRVWPEGEIHWRRLVRVQSALHSDHSDHADQRGGSAEINKIEKHQR